MNKIRNVPAIAVLSGLLTIAGLTSCQGATGDQKTGCQKAYAKDTKSRYPAFLVLLDLSDNSARTAARISQVMKPYFAQALATGAFIKMTADGGTGQAERVSDCFDGTHAFRIERRNSGRRAKDTAAAISGLQAKVEKFVRSTPIATTGSAARILLSANNDLAELTTNPDGRVSGTTVVLWSDLLGNGGKADCLDVDGQKATPEYASALISRCFAAGRLQRLKAGVRILGVGYDARTDEQSLMANLLAGDLCGSLSDSCEGPGAH